MIYCFESGESEWLVARRSEQEEIIWHVNCKSLFNRLVECRTMSETRDTFQDKHTDGHFDLYKALAQRTDALKIQFICIFHVTYDMSEVSSVTCDMSKVSSVTCDLFDVYCVTCAMCGAPALTLG